MKVKKVSRRSKNDENDDAAADSSETERQKLTKDIQQLRTLISQVERQDNNITKFSDVTNAKELLPPPSPERRTTARVPNLNVIFASELISCAGFYCVKFTKTEFVFNFSSSNSRELFSVQIWKKDGGASLGSWVMPMCVDMKKILDKTPLDSLSTVLPFLKNCKQHIDCYHERKNQYEQLKDEISDKSNCEIDVNLGFTLITLRLLGVHTKRNDSYFDLTIQLSYKPTETRPSVIGVDWSLKKDPSTLQENEMKSYAKYLRNQRLSKGFRNMIESQHAVLEWTPEDYVNSPLELNNSSDSEEETIVITAKRKRKKILTKRHKDRELRERWKKRQRQTTVSTRSQDGNSSDDENDHSLAEDHHSGRRSSTHSPDNQRAPEKTEEPPRQRQTSTTAAKKSTKLKPSRKLRQSTISFSTKKTTPSNDQKSTKLPAATTSVIDTPEHLSLEASEPTSTKSARSEVASKEKLADKTGKRLQIAQAKSVTPRIQKSAIPVAKRRPVVDSSAKKSAIPVAKNRKVGRLSANTSGAKSVNRATTSTPLHTAVQRKVKFASMNDVPLSPIAAIDETNE